MIPLHGSHDQLYHVDHMIKRQRKSTQTLHWMQWEYGNAILSKLLLKNQ